MCLSLNMPNTVLCKKGALKNFIKFIEKQLCRPATLLKKRLWHRCFPVNFVKFLRTLFFIEHLRWLLLIISDRGMTIGIQLKKYRLKSHNLMLLLEVT